MATLNNKIDFALVFTVRNANPNGDPLGGNRPRTTYDGHGEVSDVCLKRKIRNRWMDEGYPVFVQSDDRRVDAFRSLRDRADGCPALKACLDAMGEQKKAKGKKNGEALLSKDDYARVACEQWLDVRAFGQVFAFKADKKSDKKADTDDAASVSAVLPSPAAVPASPEQPPPPREPVWFLDLATNSIAAEDFPRFPPSRLSSLSASAHPVSSSIPTYSISRPSAQVNIIPAWFPSLSETSARAVFIFRASVA